MFVLAKPVWRKDYALGEMNDNLVFTENLESLNGVKMKITAADFYLLKVNGKFVNKGPNRTAKYYARVDEFDLSPFNSDNGNEITVIVTGYNCGALATVKQEPFFIAELIKDNDVLKYTGKDFKCYKFNQRKKYVDILSIQRHFTETYDFTIKNTLTESKIVDYGIKFISKTAKVPRCEIVNAPSFTSLGNFVPHKKPIDKLYYYLWQSDGWGFPEEKIDDLPFKYVLQTEQTVDTKSGKFPLSLSSKQWLMVDYKKIHAGFIKLDGIANEKTELIIATSEMVHGDTFTFCNDMGYQVHPVIKLTFDKGDKIEFESFEAYSFMFTAIFVVSGNITVNSIGFRTYERDTTNIVKRVFKNKDLQIVYDAAVRSFAHNSVDIFTDCPLRERAGWLCDSFFSARAEYFLYGNSDVETDFLENFVLFTNDEGYLDGVLPMCYPSSCLNVKKSYIPQWNLWYVLQVCEYLTVRNKNADKDFYKKSVLGVLDFFSRYENADGLVQNLPGWNFIEWSEANSWVQDLNYPTNMLYSCALKKTGETFNIPEFIKKGEKIKTTVINKSFNGELFIDHAIKDKNGNLVNTIHVSEACQYYAILLLELDLNDEKYAKLKSHVFSDFSTIPENKEIVFNGNKIYFCPKEAFIGLYLRMSILLILKDADLINKCVKDYYLDMSKKTSTLWEYRNDISSHNHGFASYVACILPFADK